MINVFRRNQRVLMLVIAILTIVAFVFLYNPQTEPAGSNTIAKIYGKNLSQADIDRVVRNYQLALAMGQYDMISDLGGMANNEQQAMEDFVWNLMIVQHESKTMGVHPTDKQIQDLLMNLPAFQTEGRYDPAKYSLFVEKQLGPRGLTQLDLEKTAQDSIATSQLKKIIASPVIVSDAEVTEAMRVLQKINLQLVRFPLPDVEKVTVSGDEVTAYFNENKAILRAPETRAVEYVEFVLPADQAALTGKAKVDAQQKVADAAAAFVEKAGSAPNLAEPAKAQNLTVAQTPDFNQTGAAMGPSPQGVAPDQQKAFLTAIAPASFLLSAENAVSDVVQDGDKFYVLRLLHANPERELTVDEARPNIELRLRMQKMASAAKVEAEAAVAKLREGVSSGRPLAEVAAPLGLKVESFAGIEPTKITPELGIPVEAVRTSLLLQPAQLSDVIPTQQGYVAAFLVSRDPLALPIDELVKQKISVQTELLEGKKAMLFVTWLAAKRDAAGIASTRP